MSAFVKQLNMVSAYKENDKLYFSAWNLNGFFECDLKTGHAQLLATLPLVEGKYGYGSLYKMGNKVFLSPCNGKSIVELNTKDWSDIKTYDIDDAKLGYRVARYGSVFEYERKLFFRPYQAHSVMEFDSETHEIQYHSECYKKLQGIQGIKDGPLYSGAIRNGSKFWFICTQSNLLISFDMKYRTTEVYRIGDNTEIFSAVCHDGRDFWIYSRSKKLLRWNETDGIISIYKDILRSGEEGVSMCYYNGRIWIATLGLRHCISVDIVTGKICDECYIGCKDDTVKYGALKVFDDGLYYLPEHNDYLYVLNIEEESMKRLKVGLDKENYERYEEAFVKQMLIDGSIIQESDVLSLESFVRCI